MSEKGTKLKVAQRVFGTDFTYTAYKGKTETVSIPFGDFDTYQDVFSEEEISILLNRIVRIDFVNYSNRKPSQKVDPVKKLHAEMEAATIGLTNEEKFAWFNNKYLTQPPQAVEETEE